MRKYLLMMALALSPSGVAAGDLTKWSGFYAGAHIGGGWGTHDATAELDPSLSIEIPQRNRGFVGGVQAGFNHQFGPWVAGVEGMFTWSGIDGTGGTNIDFAPGLTVHTNSKTNWLASFTGRAGYVHGDLLLFAKGGIAKMDFDFTGYSTFEGSYQGGSSVSGHRVGWTAGVGMEYAIARSWSARLDYDYYDFGDKTYLFDGATPVTLNAQFHTVRAGVSYHFGG